MLCHFFGGGPVARKIKWGGPGQPPGLPMLMTTTATLKQIAVNISYAALTQNFAIVGVTKNSGIPFKCRIVLKNSVTNLLNRQATFTYLKI